MYTETGDEPWNTIAGIGNFSAYTREQYQHIHAFLIDLLHERFDEQPFTFAEFGAAIGRTAIRLLHEFPLMTYRGFETLADRVEICNGNLAGLPQAFCENMDGLDAATIFEPGQVQALCIDAERQAEPLERQLDAWWPVVSDFIVVEWYWAIGDDGHPSVAPVIEAASLKYKCPYRIYEIGCIGQSKSSSDLCWFDKKEVL